MRSTVTANIAFAVRKPLEHCCTRYHSLATGIFSIFNVSSKNPVVQKLI